MGLRDIGFSLLGLWCAACAVEERCYRDADCPRPLVCTAAGRCAPVCCTDDDCGIGFTCTAGVCEPETVGPIQCPPDMVAVADTFCVDRYEASRLDATAEAPGLDGSRAMSRAGVMPWQAVDNATADAACVAAGKRLCTPAEWELACRGVSGREYGYGDRYDATTCNGIDTFSPYIFRLMPTGSFPGCTNDWGAYDMNGNLWEHVLGGDDTLIRGGAYNCADSATLHRCGYVPRTWVPSARGFRCCWSDRAPPVSDVVGGDAGASDAGTTDADKDSGGCIEPPDVTPDARPDIAPDATPDARLDATSDIAPDAGPDALPPPDVPAADTPGEDVPEDVPDTAPADATPDAATDAAATDAAADTGPDAAPDTVPDTGPDTAPDTAADTGGPPPCPDDMVLVERATGPAFCLDRYEASRSDATGATAGTLAVATSRAGVIPWTEAALTLEVARDGCAAAGKRLCRLNEWIDACGGSAGTAYGYGDTYDAASCNGIDAFCDCEGAACRDVTVCPYARCYNRPSPAGDGGPCGSWFHLVPTGSFPDCRVEAGAYDMNGNVWELTDSYDGLRHFRGGAFNCGDSVALHRCDHDGTWGPSAQGFRCCRDPQ